MSRARRCFNSNFAILYFGKNERCLSSFASPSGGTGSGSSRDGRKKASDTRLLNLSEESNPCPSHSCALTSWNLALNILSLSWPLSHHHHYDGFTYRWGEGNINYKGGLVDRHCQGVNRAFKPPLWLIQEERNIAYSNKYHFAFLLFVSMWCVRRLRFHPLQHRRSARSLDLGLSTLSRKWFQFCFMNDNDNVCTTIISLPFSDISRLHLSVNTTAIIFIKIPCANARNYRTLY